MNLKRSARAFPRKRFCLICFGALGASLTIMFVARQALPDPAIVLTPKTFMPDSGYNTRGAVASISDVCSPVGIDILERGGNAADAAVAVEFCLGVDNMWVAGLGAGGFAVVQDAGSNIVECVDFRETAPAMATRDMFNDDPDAAVFGANASGVPGELRGLEYIHRRYGKMSWKEVIQPSIDLARQGFIITNSTAQAMAELVNPEDPSSDFFVADKAWAEDFAPNGTRIEAGQTMTRIKYAELLEQIASSGPDVFYSGPIAKSTINAIQSAGGIMTLSDLEDYEIITKPAISIEYRGQTLHACDSPAGGTIVLMVLRILAEYQDANDNTLINLTTHRLDEAIRFGYAARAKLGDPIFEQQQASFEQELLSPAFARKIKSLIRDDTTQAIDAYNPDHLISRENHGTSHMATVDGNGMAISLTSTVNLHFGSRLMVPETGLIMNDEMDDFSIPNANNSFGFVPSPANYIVPKKRPLSSMSPVIVQNSDGQFYLSVGAAGGSRIITSVIENLWKTLDLNMSAKEATASPRFHDQLIPNELLFEESYDPGVVDFMRSRGHQIGFDGAGTDVHILRWLPNGTFEAASEPRVTESAGLTT